MEEVNEASFFSNLKRQKLFLGGNPLWILT